MIAEIVETTSTEAYSPTQDYVTRPEWYLIEEVWDWIKEMKEQELREIEFAEFIYEVYEVVTNIIKSFVSAILQKENIIKSLRGKEERYFIIDNTVIKDYYKPKDERVRFIWLAPDLFRDDIKKFEKLLDEFGILHRSDTLILEYHHNISKDTVERILNDLNLKTFDLPVLILSSSKTDDVIKIQGKFMDELLKLPSDSLKKLLDRFYIEISEESDFRKVERRIRRIIEQEIDEAAGKISIQIYDNLRRLVREIGVSVAASVASNIISHIFILPIY